MEPITVKTSIDFKTYFKIGLDNLFRPKTFLMALGYFVLLNALLFYDNDFYWLSELLIVAITIIVFFVIFPVFIFFKCKWIMKRHPMFKEETTYQIDDQTIAYVNSDCSGSSTWKHITKAKESQSHFLLYTSLRAFHFLLKDGFASTDDMERFKEMVKANNVKAYFK